MPVEAAAALEAEEALPAVFVPLLVPVATAAEDAADGIAEDFEPLEFPALEEPDDAPELEEPGEPEEDDAAPENMSL